MLTSKKSNPKQKPKPAQKLTRKAVILATLLATSLCNATASTWAGADGNWNNTGNPGWNATGVPNAMGATAIFGATTAARTTTQNLNPEGGGVTVGTLSFTGVNQAGSRTIKLTQPITFNQDGTGTGIAIIENTNTSASANNFLKLGDSTAQRIILADDLLIRNAAGKSGYINIGAAIEGAGNVTFNNLNTAISSVGATLLSSAANTFVGTVLIQKGTVVSAAKSLQLGNTTNAVTLGQSAQGDAAFLLTSGDANNQNNITVAANSGGILTLGKLGTGAATYSGSILLNGNLNIYSEVSNVAGLDFTGIISGTGSITHAPGIATATGLVKLSGANTFSGATNLGSPAVGTGSTLLLANSLALQNSTLNYTGSSKLVFASTVVTRAFTLGGLTGTSNISVLNNAAIPEAINLSIGNNNTNTTYGGILSGVGGSLTKTGTGTLSLTGANSYTGATTINKGTLIVGISGTGSIMSDVTVNNGGTLSGSGTITGKVTVNNGGILAAGNSPGLLTISNDLSLTSGAVFTWELNSQTTSGRGTNYDAVNVGGNLKFLMHFLKL